MPSLATPFWYRRGARPGFVLPQIKRKDVETYIKACHDRGLEFSYLLNAPALETSSIQKRVWTAHRTSGWIDQASRGCGHDRHSLSCRSCEKRFPHLKIKISTTAVSIPWGKLSNMKLWVWRKLLWRAYQPGVQNPGGDPKSSKV